MPGEIPTPPEVQAAAEEEERKKREEEASRNLAQTLTEPSAKPTEQPRPPSPEKAARQGFWGRFFRRQPQTVGEAEKEVAEFEGKVDRALETGEVPEERPLAQKEIHEMMLDPKRLPELLQRMNIEEFRRMKLKEIHGSGTIGKTKAFFCGDSAIEYTGEQDIVKTNARKDFKRRATSVGLKTLPAAVAAIFTGGAAIPAALAMVGGAVGAGGAEAWEKIRGKGQGLREEIAKVHYYHWIELKDYANKYQEASTEEEKYKYLELITKKFHESSEKAKELHCQFIEDRKRWDKKKAIATLAGSAAGFAWGALGFTHGLDLDKLSGVVKEGAKVSEITTKTGLKNAEHGVRYLNGMFQFMYGQGEKATSAAIQYGGHAWHTVGAGFQTQAAWEISKRGLAVLGANAVTALSLGLFRRGEKKGLEEDFEKVKAEQERVKEVWERRMPEMPAGVKAERAQTPAAKIEGSGGAEAIETVEERQAKFAELAKREGKELPKIGEIWLVDIFNAQTGNIETKFCRIININWTTGKVDVEWLELRGPLKDGFNSAGSEKIDLEFILRNAESQKGYVQAWLKGVSSGDVVFIGEGKKIADLKTKSKELITTEAQYRVERDKKQDEEIEANEQLTLIDDENKQHRVSVFELFWNDIVSGKKKGEAAPVTELSERPQRGEIWQLKKGAELPAALSEFNIRRMAILNIREGRVYFHKVENRRRPEGEEGEPTSLTLADFLKIFEFSGDTLGGGQQRAGGQRGGGERSEGGRQRR